MVIMLINLSVYSFFRFRIQEDNKKASINDGSLFPIYTIEFFFNIVVFYNLFLKDDGSLQHLNEKNGMSRTISKSGKRTGSKFSQPAND